MYLQSLVSAFPEARFTQLESWESLVAENAMDHLSRRGRKIMETVLKGDSGVDTRIFSIHPHELFRLDAEGLNHAFEREAPPLATAALEKACRAAAVKPQELDALFVCTCSGYLCPGCPVMSPSVLASVPMLTSTTSRVWVAVPLCPRFMRHSVSSQPIRRSRGRHRG